MKTLEVIASTAAFIPAILLAGCNDFRVKNELEDPYDVSLSTHNKKRISFSCEEGYLVKQLTKEEFLKRFDALAKSSCEGDFNLEKEKLKTLTINPGEYYSKASAEFECTDHLKPDVNLNAEELCRYLLGSSYRSLSTRKN